MEELSKEQTIVIAGDSKMSFAILETLCAALRQHGQILLSIDGGAVKCNLYATDLVKEIVEAVVTLKQ